MVAHPLAKCVQLRLSRGEGAAQDNPDPRHLLRLLCLDGSERDEHHEYKRDDIESGHALDTVRIIKSRMGNARFQSISWLERIIAGAPNADADRRWRAHASQRTGRA